MAKKERGEPSAVFFQSRAGFPYCKLAVTFCSALGGVLFMDNTLVTHTRAAMAAAEAAEVVACF